MKTSRRSRMLGIRRSRKMRKRRRKGKMTQLRQIN